MDHTQEQMKFTTVIKKTFAQIIFTVIIPFVVGLIANLVSYPMLKKIVESPYEVFIGAYDSQANPTSLLDYLLLKFITVTAVMDFCFLYITTLLFIGACLHTSRKVWIYVIFFTYNQIVVSALSLCESAVVGENIFFGLFLIFALHFTGSLFVFSVIQLPSTVFTGLETYSGIKAMVEAVDPIKGKKKVAIAILLTLHGILAGVVCMDTALIMHYDGQLTTFCRLMIGILTGVLLVIAFLLIIVVQRVYLGLAIV